MPTPISLEKRIALLTRVEDGMSIAEAGRRSGILESTARSIVRTSKATGSPQPVYKGSEPTITPRKKRAVLRDISNAPYMPFSELGKRNDVSKASAVKIVHEDGLKTYRTNGVLYVSPEHRRQRLAWADANVETDWRTIIFTDESAFRSTNVRRTGFLKCPAGEQNKPIYTRTRLKSGGWTVHVWGCIAIGKKWPLHRFLLAKKRVEYVDEDGRKRSKTVTESIDAVKYTEQVIFERLSVYAAEMMQDGREGRVVEDNAPIHNADECREARLQLGLDRADHPPNSPDLNPIEFIWNWLKDWISKLPRVPTSADEHWKMIQDAWDALPQEVIDNCVRGMMHRVNDVKEARGGPIS